MKRFLVTAAMLSALMWIGCGGDDDEKPPPDNTIVVTADTMTAPAIPLVYNDAAWNSVAATTIPLSTGSNLPVSPMKTPLGPSKALSAPDSVAIQAIKKGGRLYLRFQWDDGDLSMKRDVWRLETIDGLNFAHDSTDVNGEDQLWILFDGAPDGWDAWSWRVLTTAPANLAEDGAIAGGDTIWDAGSNRVSSPNPQLSLYDPKHPRFIHTDRWLFTGDVLNASDRMDLTVGNNYVAFLQGANNWTVGQNVPGWYFNNEVDWDAVNLSHDDSRWDVRAAYSYDVEAGYTLVLSRDLAGEDDDLDMSEQSRVTVRIGILDGYKSLDPGDTRRKFSGNFYLELPQ